MANWARATVAILHRLPVQVVIQGLHQCPAASSPKGGGGGKVGSKDAGASSPPASGTGGKLGSGNGGNSAPASHQGLHQCPQPLLPKAVAEVKLVLKMQELLPHRLQEPVANWAQATVAILHLLPAQVVIQEPHQHPQSLLPKVGAVH